MDNNKPLQGTIETLENDSSDVFVANNLDSNNELVSKFVQTSSSVSLAVMFNDKLIEKIKTVSQRENECLDQKQSPVVKNPMDSVAIDDYKNVKNRKKRKCNPIRMKTITRLDEDKQTYTSSKQTRCRPLSISLDTSLASNFGESYSEGEIKCKCSTSIGEIHICKYTESIKSNVQYLKNNADKFMQYENADTSIRVFQKRAINENWYRYYLTSGSSSPQ